MEHFEGVLIEVPEVKLMLHETSDYKVKILKVKAESYYLL